MEKENAICIGIRMENCFDIINIDGNNYKLRNANIIDKHEIMSLYWEAIGSPGCTWSEEYPNEDTFNGDVSASNLFCLVNDSGEIIAAVSIDQDEVTDELGCWNKQAGKMGELARMVVRNDYQNRGIAPRLIEAVIEVMRQRGYATVHYLVSRHHTKALAAYAKLDFRKAGECELLSNEWFCYEKVIK